MASRFLAFLRRCTGFWRIARRPAPASRLGAPSHADLVGDPSLPASLLRGLRSAKWVGKDSRLVLMDAFLPTYTRPNKDQETSIEWEDDATVEAKTLADRSHAEHGAARLPLAELARVMTRASGESFVFAERTTPIDPKQPHHGDIVYRATCNARRTKMLANLFALESAFVPPTH